MRKHVLGLMAILAAAATQSAAGQRCRTCPPEDTAHHVYVVPGFGIHVGTPQKISGAAGVIVGEEWTTNGRDHSRGFAGFVEPGLGGGRASLALIDHGIGSFGSGLGVAASMIRTWKDPWTVKPNRTYLGGDVLIWPLLFAGPRLGVFRLLNGPDVERRWLFSIDFGIGL